jgi:RNA polymerase sigma-70 factor (ECF subfamily)
MQRLPERTKLEQFEEALLPHLDAAYNLARWLTGNDHDAEDVVQDAYVRAMKFFDGFRGSGGRAWMLAIVRNTCYTWLRRNRGHEPLAVFDEEAHGLADEAQNPAALLLEKEGRELLREALEALPVEFREMVVLRDLEGLSYKEIAGVVEVPLGTVMSRLGRARERLREILMPCAHKER